MSSLEDWMRVSQYVWFQQSAWFNESSSTPNQVRITGYPGPGISVRECFLPGDRCSNKLDVTSGVPQRSALGALLFLVSVSGLFSGIYSPNFFFADDIKVEWSTDREYLSSDIRVVLDWADKWDLLLNEGKTHVIPKHRKLQSFT